MKFLLSTVAHETIDLMLANWLKIFRVFTGQPTLIDKTTQSGIHNHKPIDS